MMDIPKFFGARRKVRVGTRQSYNVTQIGKVKAEEFALSGPRLTVLQHLSEDGPCSITEVSKECNLSDDKTKLILRGLMADGYVQPVTHE